LGWSRGRAALVGLDVLQLVPNRREQRLSERLGASPSAPMDETIRRPNATRRVDDRFLQ
jgi:hypothetical protein